MSLISEDCPLCHRTERNDKLRNKIRQEIINIDSMIFDMTHETHNKKKIPKWIVYGSVDKGRHVDHLKQIKRNLNEMIIECS